MSYQRYSDKVYDILLNQEKRDYIADNCYIYTDRQIGLFLGIHPQIVNGYRIDKLHIIKQRTLIKSASFQIRCRDIASIELKALELYNYSGIMLDSVQHRINFLKDIIKPVDKLTILVS